MARQNLGLGQAAVIVLVSGLVAGGLTAMVFRSTAAWTLMGGSVHQTAAHQLRAAAVVISITALVKAAGVSVGVHMAGFRISYVLAAFAVALGAVLTTAMAVVVASRTVGGGPEAIAGAGFSLALWPVGLALGVLLPAFLIDASASPQRQRDLPEPPYIPPAGV